MANPPLHYPNEGALPTSHHQPRNSFDFNSLLSGPSFSDLQYAGYSMDSHIAPGGAFLPTANHLFPSAEDYGVVASERHLPPPLNHVRSLSDGPREPIRRSLSGSSISYFQAGPGSGYSTITNPFCVDSNGGWSGSASQSPTWGFGYDQINGERRLSASWKDQYYGKALGNGWGEVTNSVGLYQEI